MAVLVSCAEVENITTASMVPGLKLSSWSFDSEGYLDFSTTSELNQFIAANSGLIDYSTLAFAGDNFIPSYIEATTLMRPWPFPAYITNKVTWEWQQDATNVSQVTTDNGLIPALPAMANSTEINIGLNCSLATQIGHVEAVTEHKVEYPTSLLKFKVNGVTVTPPNINPVPRYSNDADDCQIQAPYVEPVTPGEDDESPCGPDVIVCECWVLWGYFEYNWDTGDWDLIYTWWENECESGLSTTGDQATAVVIETKPNGFFQKLGTTSDIVVRRSRGGDVEAVYIRDTAITPASLARAYLEAHQSHAASQEPRSSLRRTAVEWANNVLAEVREKGSAGVRIND